jgi:hypothetical protein
MNQLKLPSGAWSSASKPRGQCSRPVRAIQQGVDAGNRRERHEKDASMRVCAVGHLAARRSESALQKAASTCIAVVFEALCSTADRGHVDRSCARRALQTTAAARSTCARSALRDGGIDAHTARGNG